MDLSTMVLQHPALGQDVQLGMLYDVRNAQFYGGVSLWNNDVVNAKQALDDHVVQNAEFTYTTSLDQARTHATLDVEGSLSLDLKVISATGSAKYLNDTKTSKYEARVDCSCTVVRRTRRIPQEILASMQYERNLDDPRFTHFVAEVVEGGSATLSFVHNCSSADEATTVSGMLEAKLIKIPVGGKAKVEYSDETKSEFENVKISYSGAIAENVTSLEDARRVAREMPTKLAQQMNTLSYKLLPLTVLHSSINREIRNLDANLVARTAAALRAGTTARLEFKELVEEDVFRKWFPMIKQQISNMQAAFSAGETEFTQAARRLLPELRDGTTNYSEKITELETAVTLFEQRTRIAREFTEKKWKEASTLRTTVAGLLAEGFENHLDGLTARSLTGNGAPKLLVSFGGSFINRSHHPLQESIESSTIGRDENSESDEDKDEDEDGNGDRCEWFDNNQIVSILSGACTELLQQKRLALPDVTFGVASVNRAYRPGAKKRTKTNVGDIVLDYEGRLLNITDMLPKTPTAPKLTTANQNITVSWDQERSDEEQQAIPTTGIKIRFRPRSNPSLDGAFPRATLNEAFVEIPCKRSETSVVIDKDARGTPLFDDCDYEVMLRIETIVGLSKWSEPAVGRTPRLPSAASRIIDFYLGNRPALSKPTKDAKPWDMEESSGKTSLFLGLTTRAERFCTDSRFEGELAVRIADVALDFEPQIPFADINDQDKTIVVVFAGSSGHGKSTQINAFISFLLGGEADDAARLMVIDDRGANQTSSVTQYVTCYRIRPLSPLFEGKTFLIVDTPGYGDARGVERDMFVTAAMSEFFKTIEHVNAIIFTCRANEVRTTLLSPVSTYVFSLFAKDVQSCLRTIFTFSDAGTPLAKQALEKLNWPVDNGRVEVNNAAFTIQLDPENNRKVRDWWLMSVKGQYQVLQMLLRMPAVPTAKSSDVTQNRLKLERKCEVAEKKIFRTANDAQNLIAHLGALASAVGASPGDKILVKEDRSVEKQVEDGKATTLCLVCNYTCHKVCLYSDDKDKVNCQAMSDEYCIACKNRCHWTKHRNARYIIVTEKFSKWVVPEDMIKHWNSANNTLEGALLDAIAAYIHLQEELRRDILFLAELTQKLKESALLHDPTALIKYLETLILNAQTLGAPPEQLAQLTTAKNTLLIVLEIKNRGDGATLEANTLLEVLVAVADEMDRRMKLKPSERVEEEKKPCNLYNILREQLPPEIKKNAPKPLSESKHKGWYVSKGASYPENLKAIVQLVQVVLKDGGVVAALVASK